MKNLDRTLNKMLVIFMILTFALVVCQGCAHEDPWTRRDTIGQTYVTMAMVLDGYTTAQAQYHNNVIEGNPITVKFIGQEPTTEDTILFFATSIVANYLVTRALPSDWRPYWQWGTGLRSGWAALRNHNNLQTPQRQCFGEICPQEGYCGCP